MPESTKRLVRLGAIPNAINAELLRQMAGQEVDTASVLETLEEYYFLNKAEGGWYSFSSAIRKLLLTYWSQPEQAQEFQRANRVAGSYFEDLAKQTRPPGNYVFQRESLYHRLLANENDGLAYMAEVFERACDLRQIGPAQNFFIQFDKTLPQLSPVAAQHAAYYELRLDFLLHSWKNLQEGLEHLMGETSDSLLKARAGILLGQVLVAQYEWKKSADVLKSSLEILQNLKTWRYAARAMLALGEVYVDLVENCGGMQAETANRFGRLNQFLSHIIFLPFLLLDWLRRKIWFMPGWLYSSANYQDWILNYLLQMAGTWYRRAWRMAQKANDDTTVLKALFGQADVAIRQRREAKAQQNYFRLARLPAVQASDYRRAQVLYGQGQVSLLANRATQAVQELQAALAIFRSFGDETSVASVEHTLGTAYLQLAKHELAAQAFLESFRMFGEAGDPLSQTQLAGELEGLIDKKQIPHSLEEQVKEALKSLQEKHYLARFPADLLRQFRSLAYWVALPLSYLLIVIVGATICLSLIVIEYSILYGSTTGRLSQSDIAFLIVVGILPIPLAFWIIQVIYTLVGQVWIFLSGYKSLNALSEQPDRVILTSEAVVVERPGASPLLQIKWDEIQKVVSADYLLWQRPIHLLSRLGIRAGDKAIIIDGITTGYLQIRNEISRKTIDVVRQLNIDLVILAHRSTYLAVLFALLHAGLLVLAGQIDIVVQKPDAADVHLFLSRLLVFFIVNLIMIFPPLILWRIYLQRRLFERELGMERKGFRNFLRLSVVIILSIVAVIWLIAAPFAKIGNDETSQNVSHHRQSFLLDNSIGMNQRKENVSEESLRPGRDLLIDMLQRALLIRDRRLLDPNYHFSILSLCTDSSFWVNARNDSVSYLIPSSSLASFVTPSQMARIDVPKFSRSSFVLAMFFNSTACLSFNNCCGNCIFKPARRAFIP